MTVGDILEWVAAVCLVAAAYLWAGLELALLAAAVCLVYVAQCHAEVPLVGRKPPHRP